MAEDQVHKSEGEFRLLALDGGGIRGLFSAAVLAFLLAGWFGASCVHRCDTPTRRSTTPNHAPKPSQHRAKSMAPEARQSGNPSA